MVLERNGMDGSGVPEKLTATADAIVRRAGVLILLVLLSTVSCGGGGGDAVRGGGPSGIEAAFTAAMDDPGANTVTLTPGSVTDDSVIVKVRVTDTSGVYGAALDLIYNPIMVEYVGWAPGTFLEQGGQHPNYTVQLPSPGRIVVGVSRTGNVSGANASGSPVLIQVVLRATQAGNSNVTIQNGTLTNNQIPPGGLSGIAWFGGYVTGTEPTP
jgi:hypothetical protein